MKQVAVLWLLCMGFKHTVYAQQTDTSLISIEDKIEQAVELLNTDETLSGEELNEYLLLLAQNPINLNTASIQDFLSIPFLNLALAQAIVSYRKNERPFEKTSDILKVKGIGKKKFSEIEAFVTVGSQRALTRVLMLNKNFWTYNMKTEYLSRMQQVVQDQAGYVGDNPAYLGSQQKLYQRLTVTSNHLSLNLTQEKDAGEPFNGALGFDYTSFHFSVKDIGWIEELVIGDYALNMGQGLILWNGGAFGKGRDAVGTVARNDRGLRPYRSALEYGFQRGVAVTLGSRFQTTLFYSNRNGSASVNEDSASVRLPSLSGFHRTESEINRRYNVGVGMVGGRFRWTNDWGWIGVSGAQTVFDTPIERGTSLHQKYDFEGTHHQVTSLDYKFFTSSVSFAGETGLSQNGGFGTIHSVQYAPSFSTDVALSLRHYGRDFQSIWGAPFAESSGTPSNETGVYLGLRHAPIPSVNIDTYVDFYWFPAPRFRVNRPSRGMEVMSNIAWQLRRGLTFTSLLRFEEREEDFERFDSTTGRTSRVTGLSERASIRNELEYWVERRIRLRTRAEIVRFHSIETTDWGWVMFQDIRWQIKHNLRIDGRLTIFDTDSFNSRVYTFESDLLYVLANPVLSGQGQRMYLLLYYSLWSRFDFWLKYDVTIYEDTPVVGSGLDEIMGNTRSRIGIQGRVRF